MAQKRILDFFNCPSKPKNPEVSENSETLWRREFYEALDIVRAEIDRRFDQSGMKIAARREDIILKAVKGAMIAEADLDSLLLPNNIDVTALHLQLRMLSDLTKLEKFRTAHEIGHFLSKLHLQTRELLKEVEKLVQLCLCLPVSTASSERSFSALRRLKMWLRNTISKRRLTHMVLLHVHGDVLDNINIHSIMQEFVRSTPERKSTFGVL